MRKKRRLPNCHDLKDKILLDMPKKGVTHVYKRRAHKDCEKDSPEYRKVRSYILSMV